VRIEFAPWFRGFSELPDEDGDGHPEIYGRARKDLLPAEAVSLIRSEYAGKPLSPPEVHSWAHKLASYWYPSYNTDLIDVTGAWPDAETEKDVREALGNLQVPAPTVVMRGKPAGTATYNVFVVEGVGPKGGGRTAGKPGGDQAGKPGGGQAATGGDRSKVPRKPTPDPAPLARAIRKELAANGGSWERWARQVAPFQAAVRKKLKSAPAAVKALPGEDGFLYFRTALEYAVGGDIEKQPRKKNPLQVIKEWKQFLAKQGVDFLFVPVPTKAEIFPDKLDPASGAPLVGKVVNPYARKLLLSLAAAGVETVDLWSLFLAERAQASRADARPDAKAEDLFQHQDTHWSGRGLDLAARAIAARIERYPWYTGGALGKRQSFTTREVSFTRYGDLHSRLAEAVKKRYTPEALTGVQVLSPDGSVYNDDPDSPVVVLGDSFTGVYQLTDCEHAGVSAHLARAIGAPVDLVMSYGGGPNVRHKLMRRGKGSLGSKRLVVWIMTARDLYNYWEAWEPLRAGK
jgi:alginate O-acetyltransferase complex protein AlgJ